MPAGDDQFPVPGHGRGADPGADDRQVRERRAALKVVALKCAADLMALDTSGTNYEKPLEDAFTAYEARFDRLVGGKL